MRKREGDLMMDELKRDKNSVDLTADRVQLIEEARSIRSTAADENRELTEDESSTIEQRLNDVDAIDAALPDLKASETRQQRLDSAIDSIVPAPPAMDVRTRHEPGRGPEPQDRKLHVVAPAPQQLRSFVDANGATTNVEHEQAYRCGQFLRALRGDPDSQRWCKEHGIEYRKRMKFDNELRVANEGDNTAGGYLVPDEFSNTIIRLVNEWGVARRECDLRQMTRDTLRVSKRISGVTATWTGEGDTITASDMGWGQVELSAKSLKVLSRITNELFEDAIVDLADTLAEDSANAISEAEDAAWILGDGTSTYGGIVGVKGFLDANEGFASVYTAATGNDTYGEVTVTDLAGVQASLQPYADRAPGKRWYVSNAGRAMMFGRLGQAGGGTNIVSIREGLVADYDGSPLVLVNKLNNNAADDLSEQIMCLYGNMNLACIFGDRRQITVAVDGSRYFDTDETAVRVTERVDVVYHDRGSATATAAIAGLMGD
jgi:HK97 family phage major capsid protein